MLNQVGSILLKEQGGTNVGWHYYCPKLMLLLFSLVGDVNTRTWQENTMKCVIASHTHGCHGRNSWIQDFTPALGPHLMDTFPVAAVVQVS